MKHSYLTAGIGLRNLFRLLGRNRISLRPKYLLRLLFILQSAFWSSAFGILERVLLGRKIAKIPVPEDPVFIVGHWRTGSTFLHQLMVLDPQNTAPTLFQVALPRCFNVSYPFYKPLMSATLGKHRPMDKVRIGMDEPQEDEYAIFRLTSCSPLEKLVFPASGVFFLSGETEFYPVNEKLAEWKRELLEFYRRIRFSTKKTIISKNPFNSMRIRLLMEMFPASRFIMIVRNPLDVIPSTINMWSIVQQQNSLSGNEYRPSVEEVVEFYKKMTETMEREFRSVPDFRKIIIRYEDLERDPAETIRSLCHALSMNFSAEFEENINVFLRETGSFEKNKYSLNTKEQAFIRKEMADHMKVFLYN